VPHLQEVLDELPGPYLFPQADGSMRTEQDNLAKRLRSAIGRAGLVEGYLHHCRRCKRAGKPHEEKQPDCKRRYCPRCKMILWASALPRKFRLHDTRHTTATLLLAAGVDLYAVARILRHTDPRLTFKTYAHLVPGYLHAQIDRLPAAPPKSAALVLQEGKRHRNRRSSDPENVRSIKGVQLEPTAGVEPATYGLRNRCSAN
jgi:integrase